MDDRYDYLDKLNERIADLIGKVRNLREIGKRAELVATAEADGQRELVDTATSLSDLDEPAIMTPVFSTFLMLLPRANLMVRLMVDFAFVSRKGLAQHFGISEATISDWTTGKAAVPKKHRANLVLEARVALVGIMLATDQPVWGDPNNRNRRAMSGVLSAVARELNELIDDEVADLVSRELWFGELPEGHELVGFAGDKMIARDKDGNEVIEDTEASK